VFLLPVIIKFMTLTCHTELLQKGVDSEEVIFRTPDFAHTEVIRKKFRFVKNSYWSFKLSL
jgi:hypothetical protein